MYSIFITPQQSTSLPGDNFVDAVESNFKKITNYYGIGNVAGYRIKSMSAENGYLGGNSYGIILTIVACGSPTVAGDTGDDKTYIARITGPALEQPVVWEIKGDKLIATTTIQ